MALGHYCSYQDIIKLQSETHIHLVFLSGSVFLLSLPRVLLNLQRGDEIK